MPSFDFGEGIGGGVGGAQVGASLGGVPGGIIGGVAGFALGGLGGGKGKDDAQKASAAKRRQAANAASPDNIIRSAQKFQKAFGAQAALGGQALQSGVATNNARRGLTGTGLGTALTGAALSAPGLFAQQDAFNRASQSAALQVQAATGVGTGFSPIDPNTGLFSGGGLGDLAKVFGNLGALKNKNKGSSGPLFPGPRGPNFAGSVDVERI